MIHTFDSEVSFHSWLLWPMVRRALWSAVTDVLLWYLSGHWENATMDGWPVQSGYQPWFFLLLEKQDWKLLFFRKSNVTLVVEMKDKEFTSHKAKYALQFGTNIFMVGLSLSFKSIKQKIQFSQHSELISYLMFWKVFLYSHQYWVSCSWKKGFSHKKTDSWGVRSTCQNLKNSF